jgi:ABC-2 type transport system ATP-binding protein
MTPTPIEVREVTKRYGDFVAVDNISFKVNPGTIFGLLGPNGAGKTTTIRMIMRITIPDSGTVLVDGEPITEAAARRIGYLPEERGLYKKMKVLDHLVFLGEIRGLSVEESKSRALKWLERLSISDWAGKKVEELSKGMQQKVQFIGCVIHDPRIVILDEPFSGLDPVNARVLKNEILRFREEGRTVLFSTHVMEQAEKMCDEIALINRARVILQGTVREIKKSYSGNRMMLHVRSGAEALRGLSGVRTLTERDGQLELDLEPSVSPSDFLRRATQVAEIDGAVPHESSLDEIFVSVVSGDVPVEVER